MMCVFHFVRIMLQVSSVDVKYAYLTSIADHSSWLMVMLIYGGIQLEVYLSLSFSLVKSIKLVLPENVPL